MANELQLQFTLKFTKAPLPVLDINSGLQTVNVVGRRLYRGVQNINITPEQVTLGDSTAFGYAYFKNLDTVNFVTLQVAVGGTPFAKLGPGESAMFRLAPTVNLYATADTAPVDLDVTVIPD